MENCAHMISDRRTHIAVPSRTGIGVMPTKILLEKESDISKALKHHAMLVQDLAFVSVARYVKSPDFSTPYLGSSAFEDGICLDLVIDP